MSRGRQALLWVVLFSLPLGCAIGLFWYAGYGSLPLVRSITTGDPLLAYDSEIGFVPRPNSTTMLHRMRIYTDRRGARVNASGEQSPAQVDIITIGCSFTWGLHLDNEDTYPQRIARELGVRVANISMAGYSGTHALAMLRKNRDLRPKLIIYGYFADHPPRSVTPCAAFAYPVCLDSMHVAFDGKGKPSFAPPRSNGVERIALYLKGQQERLDPVTWVSHGFNVLRGRLLEAESDRMRGDVSLQAKALDYVLAEMQRTADEMGAKLLLVHLSFPKAYVHDLIDASGQRRAIDTLDVRPAYWQHSRDPDRPPLHFPNDAHPSAAGHKLFADEIVRHIRESGLLTN